MANEEMSEWGDHRWLQRRPRRFELKSGESVFQRRCTQCGRDFVIEVSSGDRSAVGVSILSFQRLDDEVTRRWLSEPCPGKRLPGDDDDRTERTKELRVAKEVLRE
jgi:hypothetical protein